MSIFDGLESLGFGAIEGLNLFPVEEEKEREKPKSYELPESPLDYLYEKNTECPVCITQFKSYVIRKSKLRVVDTETDLKTKYHTIDPNLYDVMICTNCGYAALVKYFNHVSEKQKELLLENIYPRFVPKEYPVPLSMENAIEINKMALLCATVTGIKSGQKAILCLKTAWIYRDLGDAKNEMLFLKNALLGFLEAFKKESFPIGAMDEPTTKYIIGELCRRTGEPIEAMKWIGEVVIGRSTNRKLKERALLVKDLIREGNTL